MIGDKQRRISIAACLALIVAIMLLSSCSSIEPSVETSVERSVEADSDCAPSEVVLEINDKLYCLVNTKQSPVYDNYNAYEIYNLEKEITSDMIGAYLGEYTTQIDNDGHKDTFKMYRYINCPITDYDWMPRIIAESSDGHYYHALIGSVFYEMTSEEVLTVYGISSAKSIVSIENKSGEKITDSAFIEAFYNGLFTSEYGGNDFLQENVYQNTGIDESDIDQLYTKYADNTVYLKVILSNGLVIDVDFSSHNYATVGNSLYFKVDDAWLDLVSLFKK